MSKNQTHVLCLHGHTLNFSLDLLEPRVADTCWQALLIVFIIVIIIIHHTVPPVSPRRHSCTAEAEDERQPEIELNRTIQKPACKIKTKKKKRKEASDQIIAVVSKIELFIHWPINIC